MISKFLAAVAAVSLAAAPALAQSAPVAVEPAAETVSGSQLRGGNGAWIAQATAGLIILFGVLLALDAWPFDDEDSESP